MTVTIPAAGGYGNFGQGDLYPTIFAGHIIHQLQKASVADQITNTLFEGDIAGGGSSVKIIKAPVITVETGYGRGAALNLQTVDADSIELLIDQRQRFSFIVDDISKHLSNIDLGDMTLKDAVYRMRDAYDTNILAYMASTANNFTSGTVCFGGGEIDPVTQREILQTGLYAHLWGADIMVSKIVPPGTIYGAADPEFVGVMPVRQDIEVIPADEPRQLKLGWVVSEEIGIGIVNPRGVAASRKSTTVG
jgi:hypothetical protein